MDNATQQTIGISDIPMTHQLQYIYNTYPTIHGRFIRLLTETKVYYNAETTCIYMRPRNQVHILMFGAPFLIQKKPKVLHIACSLQNRYFPKTFLADYSAALPIICSPDYASTPHYWNQNPPVASQPCRPAPPPTPNQPTTYHNAPTPLSRRNTCIPALLLYWCTNYLPHHTRTTPPHRTAHTPTPTTPQSTSRQSTSRNVTPRTNSPQWLFTLFYCTP